MGKKQVHLVVNGRVQSGERKPMIAQVTVAEHIGEKGCHQRPEDIVEGITRIGKGVAESRNDHTTNDRVGIGETFLHGESVNRDLR